MLLPGKRNLHLLYSFLQYKNRLTEGGSELVNRTNPLKRT